MDGELVYLFIYSAGATFTDEQLKGLLKNQEDFSKYEYTKPAPEEMATFNVPSIFNLKGESLTLKDAKYAFKVQVSVYSLGSFSIRMRCAFSGADENAIKSLSFDKEVKEFTERTAVKICGTVIKNLEKIKKVALNPSSETYRFYYIKGEQQAVLKRYGKLIAGLMVDEKDYGILDDTYIAEVLGKKMSYNNTDVFLVGWESSVLVDESDAYEHELLIAEMANMQLLEMRVYHDMAANKLMETEEVVDEINSPKLIKYSGEIKKANVVLGDFYDDAESMISRVNDTVASFGEWYLSKQYSLFESVFKLDSWRDRVEKDLSTVGKRRNFLSEIMRWRTEQMMEIIVIVLFIIDVVILVFRF